ncbi:DUF2790 domain-containing protein [Pseudomonas sp. AF32]|uniref:DUF2790 domain-containing protein n=1 Tax=Pseudomonas sp. AF32 TaxID=554390 RepID=UPI001EEF38CC|nr:DUF2790 domain-containing protein [Pseudomonas sp. AF32]MCG6574238.1 DUF2790 domain-containing protein [Pseudomonas sp. AF32]
MKLLLVLFLGCFGSVAMADEQEAQIAQLTVEPYRYSQNLDIAHVVAITQVPDVCDVVPMQMTYDDSKTSGFSLGNKYYCRGSTLSNTRFANNELSSINC